MSRPDSRFNHAGSSKSSDTTSNASAARYADNHRPQERNTTSNSNPSNYSQSAYGGQVARSAPQTERVLYYASAPDGGPPNGGLLPGSYYLDKLTGDQFHVGFPPLARPRDGSQPVPPPPPNEPSVWPVEWGPPPVASSRYQRLWGYPDPRLQDEPNPLYESGPGSGSGPQRNSSPSSYHTAVEDLSVALSTSRTKSPSGSRSGSSRESRPSSRYG